MRQFTYDYPHPAVATDIAVFTLRDGRLSLLLIERGEPPFKGRWALPGGFLRADETLEACARRELREETGVAAEALWPFANFSTPDRDPRQRVVSVAHLALLPFDTLTLAAGSDAAGARWFDVDELPPLAFDHHEIVGQALHSLRSRNDLSILFALLPRRFTLSALQHTWETVMGEAADKRNFRKTALESGLLKETGTFERGSHRPARLYEARSAAADRRRR